MSGKGKKRMNGIRVAVTLNENYIYPLKVMLHSLFTTQEEPVTILLVHTRIGKDSLADLKQFCDSYGEELVEIYVRDDIFAQAPIMSHFTKEMYYRLIFPWLLPMEERVLYLDPDMIVNASLSSFFHMNLEQAPLAAVRERLAIKDEHRKKLGLKEDTVYVNSGMLLMDLEEMRKMRKQEDVQTLLLEKEKDIVFPDQDMLNILWEGEIKLVEDAYNLNPNILYITEYFSVLFKKKLKKYGKIVHYMGPDKPWNAGYRGGMYTLWAKEEGSVSKSKRLCLLGRRLLEPYRFLHGLYLFLKNHDWSEELIKIRKLLSCVRRQRE